MLQKSKQLKKELSLFKIYALATGATLSSGFFLLPGLAAAQAGPAVIVSYLIAAVYMIPAVLSMAELATAMPRAGGVYYFIDRSLGPMLGAIGGLGTWIALVLKSAFALIGMGAYVGLFLPELPVTPMAVAFAILLGLLNLLGAKKSGGLQVAMVVILLTLVGGFTGYGLFEIKAKHFTNFFAKGFEGIYATAGLVYISYVGLTKIASVSEEVTNPERNLPLGMILALLTAIVVYTLGTGVMVGLLTPDEFYRDLTPVATAARELVGPFGAILMSIAAVLAFFLSASRYPLAMSRDHLMPRFFRILTKQRTPKMAIYVTVGIIVVILLLFEPTRIAKLASAFQLLMFSLCCLSVIIMRESHIDAYDPGFRSPLYPWMQIFGIIAPLPLIVEMGAYPILFSSGLILLGAVWYYFYAKHQVRREGAIYHIFARLGEQRFEGLERELRGILIEKGLREDDPFDMVIANASFIDVESGLTFEDVVKKAASQLSNKLDMPEERLIESFTQGTRVGATPVSHGVALPHIRVHDLHHPEIVIIRSKDGVMVDVDDDFLDEHDSDEPVHAFFFLVSPEEDPSRHLRLLAEIAGQASDDKFIKRWLKAKNEVALKELLLRHEYYMSLRLRPSSKTQELMGKAVRDLDLPPGSLIAMIHREGHIFIPRGRTVLHEGDRLTIIGEPAGIRQLNEKYKSQE